jgi:hypothetical protein
MACLSVCLRGAVQITLEGTPVTGFELGLEPLWEDTHRQLMRALALGGKRSTALAQFDKSRRIQLSGENIRVFG